MSGADFQGFPEDLFAFFRDLRANNDRQWFAANKQRYQRSVVEPMVAFIKAMDSRLAEVSDCFLCDPRPHGGSMFRIYRDIRFSHDKRPYKEHAACHFRHISGKDAHAPGFYVQLEPANVLFGGGIWHPSTAVLTRIRRTIVDEPAAWKRVSRSHSFRARFGAVRGDRLKRPPKGFAPDHPLVEDLKLKDLFALQEVDEVRATEAAFLDTVTGAFVAMKPFMAFLTGAVGLPFSLDE